MRVLPDECLPRKLKRQLPGHTVSTVPEMGWAGIKNGALLRLAEPAFDVFLTIDGNLEYQQNLRSMGLAIVVLAAADNTFDTLSPLMTQVMTALSTIQPGERVRIQA